MVDYFMLTEDDHGTKQRLYDAFGTEYGEISENFDVAMENWWMNVKATAERLCIEYGAIDTWTLFNTIRIVMVKDDLSGAYTVERFPNVIEVTRMIVAGGGIFINPNTGRVCDYAESVHEGTGRNIAKGPRPFLTDAIDLNQAELDAIIAKFLNKIER